jgi:L-fuconolactonase
MTPPRTDAHVHLWRLARGDNRSLSPAMAPIWRDMEPADLAPRLAAAGVARVVAVQAAETLAETLFLAGLARAHPVIAAVVAWVEPGSPAIAEECAALAALPPVRGVRPVRDDNRSVAWMLDARLDRGWQALADAALSLDILVQDWREIPLAAMLARRLAPLPVILDHAGKPGIAGGGYAPWAAMIDDIAAAGNVVCKLSGLMNCAARGAGRAEIAPYADHVIGTFGADRVLWASDWPPLDLASDYATWARLCDTLLDARAGAERDAILGGTAARIYRLDPEPGSPLCPTP